MVKPVFFIPNTPVTVNVGTFLLLPKGNIRKFVYANIYVFNCQEENRVIKWDII